MIEPADKGEYRIEDWKGFPNYACKHPGCKYSTLDERLIKEHVKGHRPPPPRKAKPAEGSEPEKKPASDAKKAKKG